MVVDVVRKFVEKEIMPVRDRFDDDTEHKLINESTIKMSALGVFNVNLPEEGRCPRPVPVLSGLLLRYRGIGRGRCGNRTGGRH